MPFVPADEDDFPTLGYDVLAWGEEYLVHPDGELAGQPWTWTDDQKRHLLDAYRLDPVSGQRVFRRSMLVRPKKWGKGPFTAALALCEATGPCRFDGWDADGQPVAVPVWEAKRLYGGGWVPLVQVCGTSEAQTTNIWAPLRRMLVRLHECGLAIDDGETRVVIDEGGMRGRIQPVTSSALSREGQPVTFAGADETWQWVKANGGLPLMAAIRRNVGGTSGWILETTNAPAIGSESVAEKTADGVQARGVTDVLLDWREPKGDPPDRADRDAVLREIIYVYGDHATSAGGWVVPERQLAEAMDPDTQWVDALRFYMNRRSTASGGWIPRDAWMRLDQAPAPAAGTRVTVGFDGSKGESENADHTGLVGCVVETGQLFLIRHFAPEQGSDGAWRVDPRAVSDAVEHAYETWDVWQMYADPNPYGPWLAAWEARWPGRITIFDTTKAPRMAAATERLETAVRQRAVSHDGSAVLADHVGNAVTTDRGTADNPRVVICKEFPQSTRKIDLAVCSILAYEGRTDAVADGALTPEPTYAVGGF